MMHHDMPMIFPENQTDYWQSRHYFMFYISLYFTFYIIPNLRLLNTYRDYKMTLKTKLIEKSELFHGDVRENLCRKLFLALFYW